MPSENNKNNSQPVRLRDIRVACSNCSLSELCLPVALDPADVEALNRIVQRERPMAKGDFLYRAGDAFTSVYALYSGCLKSTSLAEDGVEQITAFHLPGELMGLDAISFPRHPTSTVALETSSVCELPFRQLEDLARQIPGLQHQLLRIMSREIFEENEMLKTLARRTAEQRLAILLLSMGERFGRRGLCTTNFLLPMSRHELSNYLGLAPETLSRLFRRFCDQGWITLRGKETMLKDVPALRDITGSSSPVMVRNAEQAGH